MREEFLEVIMGRIQSAVKAEGRMLSMGSLGGDGGGGSNLSSQRV